jgi:hypothetical protein
MPRKSLTNIADNNQDKKTEKNCLSIKTFKGGADLEEPEARGAQRERGSALLPATKQDGGGDWRRAAGEVRGGVGGDGCGTSRVYFSCGPLKPRARCVVGRWLP